jgi:hypothetical protein
MSVEGVVVEHLTKEFEDPQHNCMVIDRRCMRTN